MWTETAREQYRREDLRYASDLTDAEWALIEPHMPGQKALGTAANSSASGCCRRRALHFADGVSMASATARFSEAVDGAALLLCVAGRRAVRKGQFPVGPTGSG